MHDLIETNIYDYVNNLNISKSNKNSLNYWLSRKAEGQACEDFISGMCLALQTENKITPEEALVLLLWEPKKRREESGWKSFWRSIRFWGR